MTLLYLLFYFKVKGKSALVATQHQSACEPAPYRLEMLNGPIWSKFSLSKPVTSPDRSQICSDCSYWVERRLVTCRVQKIGQLN